MKEINRQFSDAHNVYIFITVYTYLVPKLLCEDKDFLIITV